jgi:hypothetical protein
VLEHGTPHTYRTFKRPFLWPELYRSPGRVVNFFCLMKTHSCTGPLGRRAVGRQAKGFLWRRSVELRARGAVGLRWQAAFGSSDRLEWIDSTRRRTRRGAGWQAQMTEDFDNH